MNPLERGMWTVAKLRVIVVAEPRKEETKKTKKTQERAETRAQHFRCKTALNNHPPSSS